MQTKLNNTNNPEWQEAHRINQKNKPRRVLKNFDTEITAKEREGFEYDPFKFLEQTNWIKETFYKVSNPNGNIQLKRQFINGDPDDFISTAELHSTLYRKYGAELHPLVNEWANYYIDTTAGIKYDPSTSEAFVEVESTRYRNAYKPSTFKQLTRNLNRPKEWQLYLDRLMPRTELCILLDGKTVPQQHYFEAYLAQRLQEPSKPPLMAILLRGEHGTGKNFWIDNIMKHLLGDSNCVSVGLNDLTGRNTKDLYQTLLVHVEEMNDTRHKAGDKMKKLITEETARTEAKFMNATVETKYFGIIASSNVFDPIRIESNDRRWFVPAYSKHLDNCNETKAFFRGFANWLEKSDGLQMIFDYLHSLDIRGYDFRSPPNTSAKDEIMEEQTATEDNITTASMELSELYKHCVFSPTDVTHAWKITEPSARKALKNAGFVSVKRRWVSGKGINPTSRYVHKTSVPTDGNWDNVEYKLFTRRMEDNPTINMKTMYQKQHTISSR